jgi:hypothetical protein
VRLCICARGEQEEAWEDARLVRGQESDDALLEHIPHFDEVEMVGSFFELEQRLEQVSARAADASATPEAVQVG